MAQQRAPFPSEPDDFNNDPRISYSKESKTFLLQDEQGTEWEWLPGPKKWSEMMDDALVKQQAEAYKIAGVDEDAPAFNPAQKRKEAALEDPETNPKNSKADTHARAKASATTKPRQNTAVFVTGLPQDVDHAEVRKFFEKFGLIAESVDDDEARIKLYNDKEGNFKGEALIIYHRPESVQLAVSMADGAEFIRDDAPAGVISVAEADRSYKAHKDDTVAADRPKAKAHGSRAQAKKKAQEMDSRLGDWSDDEISAMPQTSFRPNKIIVIEKAFTFESLKEEGYMEDLYDDMKDMADKFGEVKNITIFDKEEAGIVTVRFSNEQAAMAFGRHVDGKGYDGRTLEAFPATGNEKYKKSRKVAVDRDADEAQRLENYSNYIEGKEGSTDGAA